MVAKANTLSQMNFDPTVWIDKSACPKVPFFLKLDKRKFVIEGLTQKCIVSDLITNETEYLGKIRIAKTALNTVRLNAFQVVILKIVNFVVRIFKRKFNKIDELLVANQNANNLIRTYTQILKVDKPKNSTEVNPSDQPNTEIPNTFEKTLNETQRSFEVNNTSPYDVSFETLKSEVKSDPSQEPIRLTTVAVEYVGVIKTGGLAEAAEGITQSILKDNPKNKVRVILPKYSVIPQSIKNSLVKLPQTYTTSRGQPYQVYQYNLKGVECLFIDHPSFEIQGKNPSIYGNDAHHLFAVFSELAADYIYKTRDPAQGKDVIHLHDWHVSGVALLLKKDHEEEWAKGETPTTVFTYHNSGRQFQGRLHQGIYSYDSTIQSYINSGIIKSNQNLYVSTLMIADGITTVSETYAKETQQIATGGGVSFAVRMAAKAGKLVGIINGIDTNTWNPEKTQDLINWKDPENSELIDLSYGPTHKDIQGQKDKAKQQLQKWINKHWDLEKPKINLSKPIVGYIGRFDSTQKGLDKLDEAIESTLKNGGQFICMGSSEDKKATELLDTLEETYKAKGGVFFIRDKAIRINGSSVWKYQQGTEESPGIGSLVRACLDFTLIPSKFEPCGLIQFEAWMFGSLAIGAETGGLVDTIIPMDRDPNNFNGFIFKRNDADAASASAVIKKALEFWNNQTKEEKSTISKRIMQQSLQYGWNSSPLGNPSPATKYRYTYERAFQYKTELRQLYGKIQTVRNRIFEEPTISYSKNVILEEEYLCKYYYGDYDSETLSQLYYKLPKKARESLPSPFGKKVNSTNYEKYGAFPSQNGTAFSVLAPKAKCVEVAVYTAEKVFIKNVPMNKDASGNWSITIPDVKAGDLYQYHIDGKIKFDPYSRQNTFSFNDNEIAQIFSVVTESKYNWKDEKWIKNRALNATKAAPMSIYEIHPLYWMKENGKPLNYQKLGQELVNHCKRVGYTHVELMGIMEHINDSHFACYQVSGYFAPTSRMGSVDDFKLMVDYLHQNNIAVILDWVPAHFSNDDVGLKEFDGTPMYEPSPYNLSYQCSIRSKFFKFGSLHFNYKQQFVRDFLISSAKYWIKEMHIDGLRVDCVRSMLSTEDKKSANLFMADLNAVIHEENAMTIAEDFSGNTKITGTAFKEGLGFDMKWHAAWMKDTLDYFRSPVKNRSSKYNKLKDAINGDLFHKQLLFYSHDDVKEKLGALINQTPNLLDDQKYANARAMMSFMMSSPGKKLYFMGTEFGSQTTWTDLKSEAMLDKKAASKESIQLMAMMHKFNSLYTQEKAFHEYDANGSDVEWIEDKEKKIHSYRREGKNGESYTCFHNFSSDRAHTFTVSIPLENEFIYDLTEVINTDHQDFGGKGSSNAKIKHKIIDATIKTEDLINFYSKFNRKIRLNDQLESELRKNSKTNPNVSLKMVTYNVEIPPFSTVIIKEKTIQKETAQGIGV